MQAALGRLGLLGSIVPLGPTEKASIGEEITPLNRGSTQQNVPLNMAAILRPGSETKKEAFLTQTIKWDIETQSYYNEDTGEIRVWLSHILTTDVLATDEITFEVGFSSKSNTATQTAQNTLITKDIAQCQITNNTKEPRFWNQFAYDLYRTATGTANVQDTKQDWKNPQSDDNKKAPLCTPPTTATKKDFACKEIKCIIDRAIDTGDYYDFQFKYADSKATSPYPDEMVIKTGDAVLGINMYSRAKAKQTTVYLKNLAEVKLPVYTEAVYSVALPILAAAAAMVYAI